MPRSTASRPRAPLTLALTLCLAFTALPASAASLAKAFGARPAAARVEMQKRLAKADLFVGVIDGKWSYATERALIRSADKITYATNGQIHPDLAQPRDLEAYLADLESGTYDDLLDPDTLKVSGN